MWLSLAGKTSPQITLMLERRSLIAGCYWVGGQRRYNTRLSDFRSLRCPESEDSIGVPKPDPTPDSQLPFSHTDRLTDRLTD